VDGALKVSVKLAMSQPTSVSLYIKSDDVATTVWYTMLDLTEML
jgi:hypothetical protein